MVAQCSRADCARCLRGGGCACASGSCRRCRHARCRGALQDCCRHQPRLRTGLPDREGGFSFRQPRQSDARRTMRHERGGRVAAFCAASGKSRWLPAKPLLVALCPRRARKQCLPALSGRAAEAVSAGSDAAHCDVVLKRIRQSRLLPTSRSSTPKAMCRGSNRLPPFGPICGGRGARRKALPLRTSPSSYVTADCQTPCGADIAAATAFRVPGRRSAPAPAPGSRSRCHCRCADTESRTGPMATDMVFPQMARMVRQAGAMPSPGIRHILPNSIC